MKLKKKHPSLSGILALALTAGLASVVACSGGSRCPSGWDDFMTFQRRFVMEDGRVVDPSSPNRHSTSEGQAYTLFFSLVDNDLALFSRVLDWTSTHLAAGDLKARLPAWQWGESEEGSTVLDSNSAMDADLWLAYILLEAARLWSIPQYAEIGTALAQRVLDEETDTLPRLGLTFLPGAFGFHPEADSWRLNPSYLPPFLLAYFKSTSTDLRWQALSTSSLNVLQATTRGFASDWLGYQKGSGFTADPKSGYLGSYDAIRVYLWVGMTSSLDVSRSKLLRKLEGMLRWIDQNSAPPESVDVRTAIGTGTAPKGFLEAMTPFLEAQGRMDLVKRVLAAAQTLGAPSEQTYYSLALSLFGNGFREGRFRFDQDGRLQVSWSKACPK